MKGTATPELYRDQFWQDRVTNLESAWEKIYLEGKKTEKPDIFNVDCFRDKSSRAWKYSNYHQNISRSI